MSNTGNRYDAFAKSKIGETHNRLTVTGVERRGKGAYYLVCACSCGGSAVARYCHLVNGRTKSCGCLQRETAAIAARETRTGKRYSHSAQTRVGETYGRLTIIGTERHVAKDGRASHWVRCQCICGNTHTARYPHLKTGRTTSCGCYQKESMSILGSKTALNNASKATLRFGWQFNGQRMRSGYEVMFAAILHKRGLEFLYEPQCFVLSPGRRYTPDFFVPAENRYYEVKGWMQDSAQAKVESLKQLGIDIQVVFLHEIEEALGESYHRFKSNWCRENAVPPNIATAKTKQPPGIPAAALFISTSKRLLAG